MSVSPWARRGSGAARVQSRSNSRSRSRRSWSGVEVLVERFQLAAAFGGEHAGGAEALVGRLGAVVDAVGPGALTGLRHELFHGLEEVDVQAGEAVHAP